MREDWKLFADSYYRNEISKEYFQEFAILLDKKMSGPFNSDAEVFNQMSKHYGKGVVSRVGHKYIAANSWY